MIDRDLVTRKLVLIGEDLRALARLAAKDRQEYLASEVDELVAERYLERLIGRMIDVNYHLLVETGHAPPRDYHQSFVELGVAGILPQDLARRLAPSAGLRNRIVHEYEEIDPSRVYEALQFALRDLPAYIEAVGAWLDAGVNSG